jgi:hypothetical protein
MNRLVQKLILLLTLFISSLAKAQLLTVSAPQQVPNPGVPIYPGFPDGHITYKSMGNNQYFHVWAGYDSYITSGTDILHQDSIWGCVLTKGPQGSYDNGGAWLYSVFNLDSNHWIGFYHAEDHEFPGYENLQKIAWKSAAQCESFDGGKTWVKNGQILTSWLEKPNAPEWGGTGDFSVVRDSLNNRWLAYYVCPDGIGVAQSLDAYGKPGSWFKLYKDIFCEPGIGGEGSSLPFSKGKKAGGNPSIMYFKPLKTWFLVYHDWNDGGIYYSYSFDLIHWADAYLLIENPGKPQRTWYPTLMSSSSDSYSNGDLFLAFAQWDDISFPYRNYFIAPVNVLGLTLPIIDQDASITSSALVLTETSCISLILYDSEGKNTHTFYQDQTLPSGNYELELHKYTSKGFYYLHLISNQGTQTRTILAY